MMIRINNDIRFEISELAESGRIKLRAPFIWVLVGFRHSLTHT